MSKKLIIMIAAAGLVSFLATFIFAWFTKTAPHEQGPEVGQTIPAKVGQTIPAKQEADLEMRQPQAVTSGAISRGDSKMEKAMTERQLKSLVYEVREKIQEYNGKLQDLKIREQRLQIAQNTLKKDIEELNNLRIELASTVARIKSEQDKLLKSRIQISETEKNNLISIAAAYDKMDSEAAGKILTNISQAQNNTADDAVKILHYMTERTKAKLLAQLATSKPKLAAYFCTRLNRIVEKE